MRKVDKVDYKEWNRADKKKKRDAARASGMCQGCFRLPVKVGKSCCSGCLQRRALYKKCYSRKMANTLLEMFADQEKRCAICGKLCERLAVDHDHKSMKIRGLLCYSCNTGLGNFYDNPVSLRAAADYLEKV